MRGYVYFNTSLLIAVYYHHIKFFTLGNRKIVYVLRFDL